ncbi:hypothetical protein KIPB_002760 [Kipferlia bialata]|uniref:Uncharacterized protein n=1 Tax=Kipferlia bialata TaxID=797122 RepID=A0A9K3GGN0_9EUKA|nr:hypothetical protein KIPB_002760 [Kipferlia bialata]|eukprot:g2760.t1
MYAIYPLPVPALAGVGSLAYTIQSEYEDRFEIAVTSGQVHPVGGCHPPTATLAGSLSPSLTVPLVCLGALGGWIQDGTLSLSCGMPWEYSRMGRLVSSRPTTLGLGLGHTRRAPLNYETASVKAER